jgi:predicted nucleic acid-binding protein
LVVENKERFLRALQLFEKHTHLDFEDCLLIATFEMNADIDTFVSYDRGFDRVADFERIEPPSILLQSETQEAGEQ